MKPSLLVFYQGGLNSDIDKSIIKAVGRRSVSSGFDFRTRTRDIGFVFATRRGAEAAAKRVKMLSIKRRYLRTRIFDLD